MISQKKLRISSCGLQMNNVLTRVEIMNGAEAKALVDPFYVAVGKSHYQARNDDTFFILLDSANNNVIGTVRYCVEEGVSMLRSMNVHPDFRGKKLGELLKKDIIFANDCIGPEVKKKAAVLAANNRPINNHTFHFNLLKQTNRIDNGERTKEKAVILLAAAAPKTDPRIKLWPINSCDPFDFLMISKNWKLNMVKKTIKKVKIVSVVLK